MMLEFIHRYLRVPYTMSVYDDRQSAMEEATIVFLHGIGNSGAAWDKVIPKLPKTVRAISLDLIGFGGSPTPVWAKYDAAMQARSLHSTLLMLGVYKPVILVGHSLGSLVAIEYARKHSRNVRSLVLCSPPFYEYSDVNTPVLKRKVDDYYKQAYGKIAALDVKYLSAFVNFAAKTRLMDQESVKNEEMLAAYIRTLDASIIQQTALADAIQLQKPIRIIVGRFDPLVVAGNAQRLQEENPHATLVRIPAGHDLKGAFVGEVVTQINESLYSVHHR